MTRFGYIIFFGLLIGTFFGCNGEQEQGRKPIWEDVKIDELAPLNPQQQFRRLDSINLQVHIFEIPAENVDKLQQISKILYSQPFSFKHFNAFRANSFSAGFGRINLGDQIFEMLSDANALRVGTVLMLLSGGQTDDLPITQLFQRTSIFYTSEDGSIQSKAIGPGQLVLRVIPEKIPGLRGVYNVSFVPVSVFPFKQKTETPLESLDDISFDCCRFSLKMSPGDFIFLSCEQYIGHQNSLGSIFFSRPAAKPFVVAFLIVCTHISD